MIVGLATLVALMLRGDIHQIGATLAKGGLKLFAVPAFMLLPLLLDAKAWQVLLRERPSWRSFVYARWVGESVNALLPVAQLGGLFVKAYLIGRRGVAPSLAMASTIVAITLSVGSLFVFIILGFVLMAFRDPQAEILLPLALAVSLFTIPVYVFYRLQRRGLAMLPPWLRARVLALTPVSNLRDGGEGFTAQLDRIYRADSRLRRSFLLQLGGWLVGTGEVWLTAYLLGGRVSLVDALILESLGQAARNVAFFVPGALGVQEGAYVLVGSALGLPPALAISISLVKRFRELVLGVPGLLVWQLNEGWSAIRAQLISK